MQLLRPLNETASLMAVLQTCTTSQVGNETGLLQGTMIIAYPALPELTMYSSAVVVWAGLQPISQRLYPSQKLMIMSGGF